MPSDMNFHHSQLVETCLDAERSRLLKLLAIYKQASSMLKQAYSVENQQLELDIQAKPNFGNTGPEKHRPAYVVKLISTTSIP